MDNGEGTMFKAVGAATVRLTDPVTPLPPARIVVDPTCKAVTSPPLLTLAMPGCVELHAMIAVRSCILPSLKVAIAWSWLLVPGASESVAGTMFKALTGATVRLADAVKPLVCARIVAAPTWSAVTIPALLTVAMPVPCKLHATFAFISRVDPSLKVAIAWSWRLLPTDMNSVAGVMFKPTTAAGITVRFAVPVTDPEVALMLVVPIAQPVAIPPAAIIATYGSDKLHVTDAVRFFLLPSLYVPVAAKGNDSPAGIIPFAGLTAMETSAGGPTVTVVEPHTEPAHALTVAVPPLPRA
jgi:hypothetical protein